MVLHHHVVIFVVGTAVLYSVAQAADRSSALSSAARRWPSHSCLPHLWFTKETDGYLPLFTIVLCAVYALFALGLNIVVGFAGLLDLGYVAFFLFGAYVGAWFMSDFAVNVSKRHANARTSTSSTRPVATIPGVHISFWIVIIIAGIVAALAGVVIGAPTLRLKSDYLALVTLGFGEILPEVFRNGDELARRPQPDQRHQGHRPGRPGRHGLPQRRSPAFPKTIVSSDYRTKYYVILAFCGLFVWVSIKLRDGRLGRAWMAIREDELAASLMGVPLMRTKLWSYAVGAVAGGVGGAFYATIVGTVNVDTFTFAFSIIVLCAVILGGMGNVWGAILGAVVITWFNYTGLTWIGNKINNCAVGSWFATFNFVNLQFGLFGLVLVLMMLFRPDGFIPAARSKQVKQAELEVSGQPRRRDGQPGGERMTELLLDAREVRVQFGGLTAVNDVDFNIPVGSIVALDRPQRRRQDDVLQRAHRAVHPDAGLRRVRRPLGPRRRAAQDRRRGHGPHVPEHPPVRRHDGGRERDGGHAPASAQRRRLDHPRACRSSATRSATPATRPRSCSSSSASAAPTTSSPRTSRTATSAGSRWRARWP